MHFVQLNTATTLSFDLPVRPDSSGATFVVKNASGGVVQSSTSATRNSVDTTVNGAVAAGSNTVTLASAAGVRVGGRYIVGPVGTGTSTREDLGGEVVAVKSVSGALVTLTQRLQGAHASGESFQSQEISCAIGATIPSAVGRHWRIEVTYSADDGTGTTTQPVHIESFDVVRFVPVTSLSFSDLQTLDAVISKRIPAGMWWPAFRDRTWEMVLRRVAAKMDEVGAGALVGAVDLTTAHGYMARKVLAETGGADWKDYCEDMATRFDEEFEATVGTMPIDNDGDGAIEPNEGVSMHTIELRRA